MSYKIVNSRGQEAVLTTEEFAALQGYANRNAIRLLDMDAPTTAARRAQHNAECRVNNEVRKRLDAIA